MGACLSFLWVYMFSAQDCRNHEWHEYENDILCHSSIRGIRDK